MKSKIMILISALSLLLVLAGCGAAQKKNSNQSEFLWQMEITHAELTDNLSNTQTFIMYDGSPEAVDYSKTPTEGMRFLLLGLKIEKSDVGKSTFSWKDVYVEDTAGARYYRMENDSFLDNYDIPRLKSTDLAMGTNTGCLCMEVPADLELEDLKLVHETAEGQNILYLSAK